jgi:hypothetical protein
MELNVTLAGASNAFVQKLDYELNISGCKLATDHDALDMFVYCIDPKECDVTDYDALLQAYEETAMALLDKVSVSLPLLDKGNKKRLCFATTLNSSINYTKDCNHWERMISASCNMAIKTLFNRLSPLGYTFRVFAVDNYNKPEDASYAAEYFIKDRSLDNAIQHSDELRLVLRDRYEREYPW